jgi:signal recognition particle receptor subunit beta
MVATTPTQMANVEDVRVAGLRLSIWDVGGQDSLRPYWRHHFAGTQGLVFVVDASDRVRLELAASELAGVCSDDQLAVRVRGLCGEGGWERRGWLGGRAQGVPIAVVANKSDLPDALSVRDIEETMKLEAMLGPQDGSRGHPWTVIAASALKNEHVLDAFDFVAQRSEPL